MAKMPMVEKGGKMVPAFAADGKGKMAGGGMAKMMAGGGKAKMMSSGGRTASKGEHPVQKQSKRGAKIVTMAGNKMDKGVKTKMMAGGGKAKMMRSGGAC